METFKYLGIEEKCFCVVFTRNIFNFLCVLVQKLIIVLIVLVACCVFPPACNTGAESTQKLVEILSWPFLNIFSSFQLFFFFATEKKKKMQKCFFSESLKLVNTRKLVIFLMGGWLPNFAFPIHICNNSVNFLLFPQETMENLTSFQVRVAPEN